jgi:Uma2 family endonuclease
LSEIIAEEMVEENEMGSINHSKAQGNLIVALAQDERLAVMPELSIDLNGLDLSQFEVKATIDLKPDISVYWQTPVPEADDPWDDIIRSPLPPDLAIEIISSSQTLNEMTNKVKAYFALGVKSCWLVLPNLYTIYVFSPPHKSRVFGPENEVIDEIIDIHLPIQKVFRRRTNKTQKDLMAKRA